MKAFVNHLLFDFKSGVRNPTQMLMNYLFPLVFFVLMGVLMVPINPQFAETMIPALVIFATLAAAVLGLPGPLVEWREAGIFRTFKINGVPALSILTIPALSTVFHSLIVSAVIAVASGPLFRAVLPTNWVAFAGVTVLSAFTLAALGCLLGVVAAEARSTAMLPQLIFLPSMLLGGLMLPVEILPAALRPVARLLPATYAMQAYQGLAYGRPTIFSPLLSVAVLFFSGLLSFALATYLFNWDSRNASRRGHPALALLFLLPYLASLLLS
jgi:ABC-2 type transport system permease protein